METPACYLPWSHDGIPLRRGSKSHAVRNKLSKMPTSSGSPESIHLATALSVFQWGELNENDSHVETRKRTFRTSTSRRDSETCIGEESSVNDLLVRTKYISAHSKS